MTYRTVKTVAYAVGYKSGELWDEIYRVCDTCGAIVIDRRLHDEWHGVTTITRVGKGLPLGGQETPPDAPSIPMVDRPADPPARKR
jgi:hypothetical protein